MAVVDFINASILSLAMGGTGEMSAFDTVGAHLSTTGVLMSIATAFLYYQATTKWFLLLQIVGVEGAKEAKQMSDTSMGEQGVGTKAGQVAGSAATSVATGGKGAQVAGKVAGAVKKKLSNPPK